MNMAHTSTGILFIAVCLTVAGMRFESFGWGAGLPYLPKHSPTTINELIVHLEHRLNDRNEHMRITRILEAQPVRD